MLYLAAQSSAWHNAGLREFYQGLRARGKPGKVALAAVMRKLITQPNAIALRGPPGRRPRLISRPRPPENRLTRNTDTPAQTGIRHSHKDGPPTKPPAKKPYPVLPDGGGSVKALPSRCARIRRSFHSTHASRRRRPRPRADADTDPDPDSGAGAPRKPSR